MSTADTVLPSLVVALPLAAIIAACGVLVYNLWEDHRQGPRPVPIVDRAPSTEPEYTVRLDVRADGTCWWEARLDNFIPLVRGDADTEAEAMAEARAAIDAHRGRRVVKRVTVPITDLDSAEVDDLRARVEDYHAERAERESDHAHEAARHREDQP